jgi:hypothetical protein
MVRKVLETQRRLPHDRKIAVGHDSAKSLINNGLVPATLKVHKHNIFLKLFLQKPKPYGPKGLQHKIFENRIRYGICSASNEIHSAYAQPAMKFVPRMLSQR